MTTLLVTYDLQKPGQDYSDFHKIIKAHNWAKLSESSYAVETNEPPQSIYDKLAEHMDKNDQVYVITLKSPYYGMGPAEVNNWLKPRL